MNRLYKIFRAVLMVAISLAVTVPAVIYVGLSLPSVQDKVADVAKNELGKLLDAEVDMKSLSVTPFNRVMLRDVSVSLKCTRDTLMTIERLGAGIDLYELVVNHRTVINYVEIIGADVKLRRELPGSPLNIQPIIEKLKSKDPNAPSRKVNMAVNTVILRNTSMSYDVDSVASPQAGRFSAHHVGVYDLNADLRLPAVGIDSVKVDVKRFKVKEKSGLEITDIRGNFVLSPTLLAWENVRIDLPESYISLRDLYIPNNDTIPLGQLITTQRITTGLLPESYITPHDLAPIAGVLENVDCRVYLQAQVDGIASEQSRIHFEASTRDRSMLFDLSASLNNVLDSLSRSASNVNVTAHATSNFITQFLPGNYRVANMVQAAEYIDIKSKGTLGTRAMSMTTDIATARGDASVKMFLSRLDSKVPEYDIEVLTDQLEIGPMLQNPQLGQLSARMVMAGKVYNRLPKGMARLNIDRLDWNGHPFGGIYADILTHSNDYSVEIESLDPAARLVLNARGQYSRHGNTLKLQSQFDHIDVGEIMPQSKWHDYALKFGLDGDIAWQNIDDVTGYINLHNLLVAAPDNKSLSLNGVKIAATGSNGTDRLIELHSDIISGEVEGNIYFSTMTQQFRKLAMESLPVLLPVTAASHKQHDKLNRFDYKFTVHDTEQWAEVLKFPVSNLGNSDIKGRVDYDAGALSLVMNARYLRQGNKLIEKTELIAGIDGSSKRSKLYFATQYPTKHGAMALQVNTDMADNAIGSKIDWRIDRKARYEGDLSFSATLSKPNDVVNALIKINPGELTFNDSTWIINSALVKASPQYVAIDGLNAHRSGQFIKIDGTASVVPEDVITIDLLGINLDYIFESLGIDKAMLGGDATGHFYLSNLFGSEPRLETPGLVVKAISYNKVVLGDATVKSRWDKDTRGILLDAVVTQPAEKPTLIYGGIYPMNDSLDLTFDANNIDASFMYPYMSAFATEVSGRATGKARLWGNFKRIDLAGKIKANDFKIKIGFTNVAYSTSDVVTLNPGEIILKNIEIRDDEGHKARLNGYVRHRYFKEPQFDFNITNANRLLVYDETEKQNPDWYGHIYGNGTGHIKGRPGVIDIQMNMSMARGSTFTFVLNDREDADSYNFITYRDRDRFVKERMALEEDDTPSSVRRLRQLLAKGDVASSSAYNISLIIDITPEAAINLIMDPAGGDHINSWGNGSLNLAYKSLDNELTMYGTYNVEHGKYNFTLQDLIIKDFTIKPGSSIKFNGDPFAAVLDITAAYSLTANLLDLDESFAQDKELQRTTVPVNTLLLVSGPIQQPEVDFGLELPTVNQDTDRKVKSIVSTKEMMQRQVIYLLALNRFYTPDYMASAQRGNELVSVASSTLSSQLGNILGSLSDNWNIAPTFRSDRGDFSDMEVDVALSSSLLNNRLLFNGNFGYRDKSLNNTQFVGDFDLEYLLNRAGTLRLKAYNRYNDMNYYVRTAETTQGVGISFRRNFNNLSELLHGYAHRQPTQQDSSLVLPVRHVVPLPADSLSAPIDSTTVKNR